jgi:protein TonB
LVARVNLERGKLVQVQELGRKIAALVAKAQGLTSQGRLVAPKGASALDALLEARRLDPTNAEVARGSRDLAQALAQEANRLIKAGNLYEAQSLVTSARVLGSDGVALAAVESALSEARDSAAASRQPRPAPLAKTVPPPAVVASPGAKEALADNRRAPSESKPVEPKPIEPKLVEPKLVEPKPIEPKSNNLKEALPAPRVADPARVEGNNPVASATRDSSTPGTDAGATQAPVESRPSPGEAAIVPAASLRRIRTVEPVYPVAARRRKEQGMVEVLFTVTPDGGVENVEVRKSMPEQVFDEAAKKAVEQWRFEPVKVNGQAVSQRAFARLRFAMD